MSSGGEGTVSCDGEEMFMIRIMCGMLALLFGKEVTPMLRKGSHIRRALSGLVSNSSVSTRRAPSPETTVVQGSPIENIVTRV